MIHVGDMVWTVYQDDSWLGVSCRIVYTPAGQPIKIRTGRFPLSEVFKTLEERAQPQCHPVRAWFRRVFMKG